MGEFKIHSLYEIFRHEQERAKTDIRFKGFSGTVSYNEDKNILQYSDEDGTATVTFTEHNGSNVANGFYYKFNEELHPEGSIYSSGVDEFGDKYENYVPANDEGCEYGFKVCDIYPPVAEGCCGKWADGKGNYSYRWVTKLASDWALVPEKVGLVYSKEELAKEQAKKKHGLFGRD